MMSLVVLAVLAACASPGQHAVQLAQEKQACAELGIDPGSESFSTCVGNLDATMFEASNTMAR
jgi:hypothetical protein